MLLDKAGLIASSPLNTEDIAVDGGSVRVTEIGAVKYLRILQDPANQDGDTMSINFIPALLAHALINENGERLFSDGETALIGQLPRDVFRILAEAAKRLNGLAGEEIKNSEASLSTSSCIDCACISDTGIQDSL